MRFLFQYKPAGTRSYRLSSSKMFDFGGNSQNNDKESMDIFEAPPGWVFVQRDQAGAEALFVAYDARPGRYRALFENGVKAHTYVALHLFIDKFRGQHSRDRYWCKTAPELKELEEWAQISKAIAKSKFEYDIGKKTGHACCDEQTEVLTPHGWVPISQHPVSIMVSNSEGYSYFSEVSWNSYDYNGPLYNFVGEEVDQAVTPTHKMLYETNGKRKIKQADEFAKLLSGSQQLVVSGYSVSRVTPNPAILQLAVAIQADGNWVSYGVRFQFAKQRKIERLTEILNSLKIPCDWHIGKTHRLTISNCPELQEALSYLNSYKEFTWKLLGLSIESIQIIIDEVKHWDGTFSDGTSNYKAYFSTQPQNTDVIYMAARLCGMGSTRRLSENLHTVSFNRRQRSQVIDTHITHYNGKVHCPTTRHGFFWIRRNGKISITGNSNYKMGPVTFRDSVLKESEGTMVLTMEQARFYLDTYKELFPEIVVWQQEIENTIRQTRLLRNAFGYPRRFERIITDSYLREAISWKPQSTIGVITHKAFVATRNYIVEHKLRWRPISNKHDSYALMIPETDIEPAREIMMRDINQEIVCAHGTFTMKSDFQVGYNLRKYHETHNPRGMREL